MAPSLFLEFRGSESALNDQVKVVSKFNMQNIFVLFFSSINTASIVVGKFIKMQRFCVLCIFGQLSTHAPIEERGSSVAEWLTQDRVDSSNTGSTALCPGARHFVLCFKPGRPILI